MDISLVEKKDYSKLSKTLIINKFENKELPHLPRIKK